MITPTDHLSQAVANLIGEAAFVSLLTEDTRLTAFVRVPALGLAFEVIGEAEDLLASVCQRTRRIRDQMFASRV